jgi:hypothetical protein
VLLQMALAVPALLFVLALANRLPLRPRLPTATCVGSCSYRPDESTTSCRYGGLAGSTIPRTRRLVVVADNCGDDTAFVAWTAGRRLGLRWRSGNGTPWREQRRL